MTISARGPRNILVLDRSGVQITEVCDTIAEEKDLDLVLKRFPITTNEAFECIEVFADTAKPSKKDKLELRFVRGDDPDDLDIEAVAITDRIYFLVISYARSIVKDCDSINDLFRYGLELIISDCMEDIKNNTKGYENSEVHNIVFNAYQKMHEVEQRSFSDADFKLSDDLERALRNVKP